MLGFRVERVQLARAPVAGQICARVNQGANWIVGASGRKLVLASRPILTNSLGWLVMLALSLEQTWDTAKLTRRAFLGLMPLQ